MTNTVYVRASRATVRRGLATLTSDVCGGGQEANAILVRCAMAALGRIRAAFVVKARGGTDEAGERWQPLSPKTIAYSRTRQRGSGGRTKTEKKRESRPSQALTQAQQARWWDVYRWQLKASKGNKGHAAAVAWVILKKEGATTLLEKYGNRRVEILRDTGMLLNSLSPGITSSERILRVGRGEVTVGTNRKGAAAHHHGVPGKLPKRRLWPPIDRWPTSWWRDITDQVRQGILDITALTARGVT